MKCKALRCIYYNEGNGYTVASYVTEEALPEKVSTQKNSQYGMFTAVGNELPTEEGLEVELNGTWKDGKFGMQYKVSSFQVVLPTNTEGIKAYLASDFIKGIGPVLAERIVDHYKEKTFEILEKDPERLLEIKGITKKKLVEILEGYQSSETLVRLMVALSPFGVTPRKVTQIQEHFGNAAPLIIQDTPFRLCEIPGFGFLTVDPIAVKAKNFKPDEPMRIKAAILHVMSEAEGEGHLYLSCEQVLTRTGRLLNHKGADGQVTERAIRDVGNEMIREDGTLVCNAGGFYAKKSFEAELGAAASLVKFSLQKGMGRNVETILRDIQKKEKILLNARQKAGILEAFQNPVSIITGGPGRGKTTIIRFIMAVQEALNKNAEILLCAPTGCARRRMSDCTAYPALTIHKAVGLKGEAGEEEWSEECSIQAELIIVDECSMIDMYLMDKFLSRVQNGARMVFLGDKDQLESVGPGNVFKEMIESGVIPVTVLTESFRQEGKSTIIQNADKINERKTNLVFDDTFQFYPAADDTEASELIQKLYREELQKNENQAEGIQVISPLRKDTRAGADALNPVLRDIVNPKRYGYPEIKNGTTLYREKDLVMQLKNIEEVANGDVGEVLNIYRADGKNVMRVDFGDGKIMEYTDDDIWPLNLAYCITVHKAQGDEYPVVILPMLTSFYRMLRKNLFYTAVTRAKRKVIIVGSKNAMAIAIKNDTLSKRNTMFGLRIRKIYEAYLEQEKKSA